MITENHSDLTRELVDWVNINSASDNVSGLQRMAEILMSRLEQLPGTTEKISLPAMSLPDGSQLAERDIIRFRFNPKASRKIFFSGHMDTVYNLDHPFQKADFDQPDHIHGPGVADMKGGLLIMIEAVKRWLERPDSHELGGEILITSDEEVGSFASTPYLKEAAEANDIGLVFESALPNGDLVGARKGNGTFHIIARGKSAHTGRDFQKGVNALTALAAVIHHIHTWNERFPDAIINVGRMHGGGALNMVPDFAEAFINIRISRIASIDEIKNALHQEMEAAGVRHPGVRFHYDGDFTRPPKLLNEPSEELFHDWNSARQKCGLKKIGLRDTGGSSDGNILAFYNLAHLDGVGIHGDCIHSLEEFALISSIEPQIETTLRFMEMFANAK